MLSRSRKRASVSVSLGVVAGAVLASSIAVAPAVAVPSDWPDAPVMESAYGIAFDAPRDKLYVADRWAESIVTLDETGQQTTVVDAWDNTAGVAVNSVGDIYFTIDGDQHIYRVAATDLAAAGGSVSLTSDTAEIAYTTPGNYLYALAVAPDDTLYVYTSSDDQLLRMNSDGSSLSILTHAPAHDISALAFTPSGDLYAVDDWRMKYTIPAGQLAAPAASSLELDYLESLTIDAAGLAFFGDGRSHYIADYDTVHLVAVPTPAVAGTATITGASEVGSTLAVTVGSDWSYWSTFTYRWLRDGAAITDATNASYAVTADDAGAAISVEVTGFAKDFDPGIVSVMASNTIEVPETSPASDDSAHDSEPELAATGVDMTSAMPAAILLLLMGAIALRRSRRRLA